MATLLPWLRSSIHLTIHHQLMCRVNVNDSSMSILSQRATESREAVWELLCEALAVPSVETQETHTMENAGLSSYCPRILTNYSDIRQVVSLLSDCIRTGVPSNANANRPSFRPQKSEPNRQSKFPKTSNDSRFGPTRQSVLLVGWDQWNSSSGNELGESIKGAPS